MAVQGRHKAFHCSEAVFLAVNEVLKLGDPALVKLLTGFHGGGGAHRKVDGANLTEVLEDLSMGRYKGPMEEAPVVITGHLCGALAAGVACFGLLYGRTDPTQDLTCVDELTFELHRRFEEHYGSKLCTELRKFAVPLSGNGSCEYTYRTTAEMIVDMIIESGNLVDRCPGFVMKD